MQPKRPLLPELYALRDHPKAGPVWRPRYLGRAKAALELVDPPLKLGAAGERARLVRSPGADLTVARPAGEIGIRGLVVDLFDGPFDANLSVERLPQKAQRGIRIGKQLRRFSALEVGVEYKSALIEPLQQHGPSRRSAVWCGCRQGHRMRVRLALPSFIEPSPKRRERFNLGDPVYHSNSHKIICPDLVRSDLLGNRGGRAPATAATRARFEG